jgi:hypothetical protein
MTKDYAMTVGFATAKKNDWSSGSEQERSDCFWLRNMGRIFEQSLRSCSDLLITVSFSKETFVHLGGDS